MADLRALLADAGYEDARTLLASGNVVLDTADKPEKVERAVKKVIAEGFGHDVEVIARTAAQIEGVVKANPLAEVAIDGSKHFVAFLSGKPGPAALKKIGEQDLSPDSYAIRGREAYVWCPYGLRESPAMKALSERNLGVSATLRNWNTVLKVHEACTKG